MHSFKMSVLVARHCCFWMMLLLIWMSADAHIYSRYVLHYVDRYGIVEQMNMHSHHFHKMHSFFMFRMGR